MLELAFPPLSAEEYLTHEQEGDVRHEYVSGYRYGFAGASGRHNRIAGNIYVHLWGLAQERPCRIYQEGMKLRIQTEGTVFYYPDVMVVCERDEPDPYFETEPCVLVEVLSPGTKHTDLREKLTAYKSLPSVQTYLIVEAERLAVRHIAKRADGTWLQEDLTGDGDIALPCLGGVLSLPQIYRNAFWGPPLGRERVLHPHARDLLPRVQALRPDDLAAQPPGARDNHGVPERNERGSVKPDGAHHLPSTGFVNRPVRTLFDELLSRCGLEQFFLRRHRVKLLQHLHA